jgi:hypothetical protein
VDFVIYGERGFRAIEVQSSANFQRSDLRGLRSFREDCPEAQLLLLHRGEEALRVDGIPCLPCDTFLRELLPGQLLPGTSRELG